MRACAFLYVCSRVTDRTEIDEQQHHFWNIQFVDSAAARASKKVKKSVVR